MIAMSRRLVPEGSSPNTMRGEDGVQIQQQRVTICFSGIKTTNRNGNTYCPSSYKEMVESLGCQYSTVMDVKSVGYLVVGKVGMDKHVAALKYKIPCVTEKWLIDSFKSKKLLPVRPKDDDNEGASADHSREEQEDYSPPLLHGLSVLMTNISGADRRELQQQILSHGAGYTAGLDDHSLQLLTHCITDRRRLGAGSADVTSVPVLGDKLACICAYNAGIPAHRGDKRVRVVDRSWVEDMLKCGHWIPESSYIILLAPTNSTAVAADAAGATAEGTSGVAGGDGSVQSSADTLGSDRATVISDTESERNRLLYFNDIRFEELPVLVSTPNNRAPLPFAGSVFFVCGFSDLRVGDYLARAIALGGGRRSVVFTGSVNVVVVGSAVDLRTLRMIRSHPVAAPANVHAHFILEALRHCGLVSAFSLAREFVDVTPSLPSKQVVAATAGDSGGISGSSRDSSIDSLAAGDSGVQRPRATAVRSKVVPTSNIINKRFLRNASNAGMSMQFPASFPFRSEGSKDAPVASVDQQTVPTKRKFGL